MTTKISIKPTSWTSDKDTLRSIRTQVFVEEQQVPIELEWDEHDEQASHWLAYADGQAVGCCRMLANGHIGRMAVLPPFRNTGIGQELLAACVNHAKTNNVFEAYLYSQVHAVGFYQQAGFEIHGDEFMDANIPHLSMRLQLQPHRSLGIHGGDFSVHHMQSTALELIDQTSKQLRILSYALDHRVFDQENMEQHISRLARKSRYSDIRILIIDPQAIISRGHRLLRLHRRLSSSIKMRTSTALAHDIKNNLIIADHSGLICQSIKEPEKAWANFHNRPVTENYIAQFDDLWERAVEDRELRQLEI